MKNTVHAVSTIALLATAPAQAQTFDLSQVAFWVGAGPDSSVLVIDFQDGSDDPSYAWGFLHDGTATGEDMITAIAAADINLTVDIPGGFINSVTYGDHIGIGGAPNYWSTWSGTGIADMAMNAGISEVLSNGEWLGCSYTDFDPALPPTAPIAAYDPLGFTADDVLVWAGTGAHTALLVIDFQDGSATPSYAWGVRFDGTTTGEAMINAVMAVDPSLQAVITSGFLSEVTYGAHAGIGGSPDWWSTWSATNLGNWVSNFGLATTVNDGGLFGCSYTDFAPALRPSPPVAAGGVIGIDEGTSSAMFNVHPQPATDVLFIRTDAHYARTLRLTDLAGRVVMTGIGQGLLTSLDVSSLPAGLYVLHVGDAKRTIVVQ
jgi:hypothetical protein